MKNMVKTCGKHYWADTCYSSSSSSYAKEASSPLASALDAANQTMVKAYEAEECNPDVCFLSLILMLGTLWLGVTLFDFTKTPFLNKGKREVST